jgi:ABC-2 type transport system ATP-binding protein
MQTFSTKKPILKIQNVCKSFGKRHILENISFEILQGEIISIFGLSGCGKSTLLSLLCGYQKQDSGTIECVLDNSTNLFFKNIRSSEIVRSLFGFASQEPSFYPNLTVFDNLKYFGTLLSVPKNELKDRIYDILHILNLSEVENSLSSSLSEGMKKRLDIGCSIIHNPKILILDEPTANLDFQLRDELLDYVKEINKLGMTIVFVSHYIEEVIQISDRVAIISNSYLEVMPNDSTFRTQYQSKLNSHKQK